MNFWVKLYKSEALKKYACAVPLLLLWNLSLIKLLLDVSSLRSHSELCFWAWFEAQERVFPRDWNGVEDSTFSGRRLDSKSVLCLSREKHNYRVDVEGYFSSCGEGTLLSLCDSGSGRGIAVCFCLLRRWKHAYMAFYITFISNDVRHPHRNISYNYCL